VLFNEIRKTNLESRYDTLESKRVSLNFYNNGYGKGKTREKIMDVEERKSKCVEN